jgi:hypothetical protein
LKNVIGDMYVGKPLAPDKFCHRVVKPCAVVERKFAVLKIAQRFVKAGLLKMVGHLLRADNSAVAAHLAAAGGGTKRKKPVHPDVGHNGDPALKSCAQPVVMVGVIGVHDRLSDDVIAPVHQLFGAVQIKLCHPHRISGLLKFHLWIAKRQSPHRNLGLTIPIVQQFHLITVPIAKAVLRAAASVVHRE